MKAVLAVALCALTVHADALSDAYDALKRDEAAQNTAALLDHARETSRLARQAIAQQAPPEARDEYQKERAIYLEQTDTYTEYSMAVATGYPGNSPALIEQLFNAIVEQNRDSIYLSLAVPNYLAAFRQQSLDRQLEAAAHILELRPDNEDALLAQAEGWLSQDRFADSTRAATRLLEILPTMPRPQASTDAYWASKKPLFLTRAHIAAGISACRQDQWQPCDTQLRQVPTDGAEPATAATVNLYLGLANFNLGKAGDKARLQQALEFTRKAAAIPGPAQQAAQQNLTAIQATLR